MSCPSCSRAGVTPIGGFCGHCSTEISGAVNDALDDIYGIGDVVDVFEHSDGYVHVCLEDPAADGGAE